MQSRRQFFLTLAAAGSSALFARKGSALQAAQSMTGPMEQNAHIPVKLQPKPGAAASMTDQERDDLEHQIKCQCGCPLDVFTCRTTDFSCLVSPAMHTDVMGLVAGGYGASEILAAFQKVYGERVLMAPLKRGFNLVGYIMPFAVLITGGVVVAGVIRKWGARADEQRAPATVEPIDATDAEFAELQAAVREDK